jgi:hypothetical protein
MESMTTLKHANVTAFVVLLIAAIVGWVFSSDKVAGTPAARDAALTALRHDVERLTAQYADDARQAAERQASAPGDESAPATSDRWREVDDRLQRLEHTLQALARYADQVQRSLIALDKAASTPTVLEGAAQRQRDVLVGK